MRIDEVSVRQFCIAAMFFIYPCRKLFMDFQSRWNKDENRLAGKLCNVTDVTEGERSYAAFHL